MNVGVGIPFIAQGALTRGMAVIKGTAYGTVAVTSGANGKIVGYVLNDAADGQEVSVYPINGGGKCKAIAGASFNRGDALMGEGSDGRLKALASATTVQYGAGIALEDGSDGQLVDILPAFWAGVTSLT